MIKFVLIHIQPKTREEVFVAVVDTLPELRPLLTAIKYDGTWLSDTRKLLRYGRGELVIREYDFPPRVQSYKAVYLTGLQPVYILTIVDDDELRFILLNNKELIGYTTDPRTATNNNILWRTNSFTTLADFFVGKELAYDIHQYFDKFLIEFKLNSAI